MKTNKVLKWLYGVFMFLPMLAIGVTCAYVTFNKNAKDSYSDQLVARQDKVSANYTYIENETYNLTFNTNETFTAQGFKGDFTYDFHSLQNQIDNSLVKAIFINQNTLHTYRLNNGAFQYYVGISIQSYADIGSISFVFKDLGVNSYNTFSPYSFYNLYVNTYTTQSLDNAFYYAVDQFNESGFNKIDFVSFFDMFYENTNIWTIFANTYMNYVLFVSLAFFIPRVLYWFINLAFSLTDSFERKSQGW